MKGAACKTLIATQLMGCWFALAQTNTNCPTPTQPSAIQVNISPADAVRAGAQWRIDGGALQNSGAVVTNLAAGKHVLSFKPIAGGSATLNRTVMLNAGQTKLVNETNQMSGVAASPRPLPPSPPQNLRVIASP